MPESDEALPTLARRIRRLFERTPPRVDALAHAGCELRTPPERYDWHGLRRGGDPRRPFVLFQYTLEGFGRFDLPGSERAVRPGEALLTVVPTEHRYHRPPEASRWGFVWLIVRHAFIVERIARRVGAGAVLAVPPESEPIARLLGVLEVLARPDPHADPVACEQALFDFLFAYERLAHARAHPADADLRGAVRAQVLRYLHRPVSVAEIAARFGQSRTHFTHAFARATGLAPGRYIAQVRIAEAARRLLDSTRTLAAIARETGFTDATHLCKTFRRHYHLTPGAFRRRGR